MLTFARKQREAGEKRQAAEALVHVATYFAGGKKVGKQLQIIYRLIQKGNGRALIYEAFHS